MERDISEEFEFGRYRSDAMGLGAIRNSEEGGEPGSGGHWSVKRGIWVEDWKK